MRFKYTGRSSTHRQCEQGFNVKELIVVVAVVAILAFLAGGVLKLRARFQLDAGTRQCQNNLSRIGKAFAMYEGDNDGKIPYAGLRAAIGVHWSWDDLINKQLGGHLSAEELRKGEFPLDIPVLRCPADTVPINETSAKRGSHRRTYVMPLHDMKDENWPPSSWNYTGVGLWWDLGKGSLMPISSTRWVTNRPSDNPAGNVVQAAFKKDMILNPKGTIALTERLYRNNIIGNASVCTVANVSQHVDSKAGINPESFHRGQFNYLFADWHVENLPPEKTLGKSNPSPAYQSGMWTVNPND